MEQKPHFNLHLTYEDAIKNAESFQKTHKAEDGKDFHIWTDPRNIYGERMKFKLDGIDSKTFDSDIKEYFDGGTIEEEAKAALIWLIDRHKGFNPLELGQIIVGVQQAGIEGDREVAIFTYLSREDDCLRDFITEKAFDLTYKK